MPLVEGFYEQLKDIKKDLLKKARVGVFLMHEEILIILVEPEASLTPDH